MPPSTTRPSWMKCWAPLLSAALGQFWMAQSGAPWTLAPGLFFYGLALWLLFRDPQIGSPAFEPLSLDVETVAFVFIFLIALFLRVYQLDSMPDGMHTDQGLEGEYGLWVLKGWRPFYDIYSYPVPELLIPYFLAGWFWLFGSSYLSFHLFFVTLAMASFPFIYWAIRQLAGPRTALLSFLLLGLMRWNWIEPRTGYPSCQTGFFLFAGLAFWLHWVMKNQKSSFYPSALFLGLGLYTYQIFKVVPLLFLLFGFYEFRRGSKKARALALWAGLFLLLALPLLAYLVLNHTAGNRESDIFIGNNIKAQHSLKPLWDQAVSNILMFNRQGDPNPRHNLPGTRMLDDITGVCFVLGLGLAWLRRKERGGFYPLAGFLIFLAVGTLANDPANSNRLWILSVFAAYFAGTTMEEFWRRLALSNKTKWLIPFLGFALIAPIAVQNYLIYFEKMDQDPACQTSFGLEQTYIGRGVENLEKLYPGRYRFYLPPLYYENHTTRFLADASGAAIVRFNLNDLAAGNLAKDKDAVFFTEEGKAGVLDLLKTIFPGGTEDALQSPDGRTLVSCYAISNLTVNSFKGWDKGLTGTYWNTSFFLGTPVTVKSDPLLNFTSKQDFPFTNPPPFSIRWKGHLEIPASGEYQFECLTQDQGTIFLDGKKIYGAGMPSDKKLNLHKGEHSIKVEFIKTGGDSMAVNLIWMHPGSTHWEVVPASTFGKINQRKL